MDAREDAPETVGDAVELLHGLGYADDFLPCSTDRCTGVRHPADSSVAEHVFRFEGESDPGDAAIVVGVWCPVCGKRGVLVTGYGASADPEVSDFLWRMSEPEQGNGG
jgi:hypothetical protein